MAQVRRTVREGYGGAGRAVFYSDIADIPGAYNSTRNEAELSYNATDSVTPAIIALHRKTN